MPLYRYTARDAKGSPVSGEMEAPDERIVASTLREHQLSIITISEKRLKNVSNLFSVFDKLGQGDVLNFTRQFSIMVSSGLSITEALTIMQAEVTKPTLKRFYEGIFRDVQSGSSLSKAFEKYPQVFPPTYVALVRAGESSGLLEQIFTRLSDTLEKQKEFQSKTRGALIYPAIVLGGMFVVIFIMLVFVIPKLSTIYASLGTQLPLPTLILVALSNFAVQFWWLIIIGVIGSVAGFIYWKRTKVGNLIIDGIIFKVPIFGNLRKINILTEITRILGVLVMSGVPIMESLRIVSKTSGSVHYEEQISQAALSVEKGFTLAQALTDEMYFPKIVSFMVRTGEETGKLGDVLLKLSHYYEIEAEQRIKNLTVALEPIIMIVLGIGVGFLILSIILPIYKLTSSF